MSPISATWRRRRPVPSPGPTSTRGCATSATCPSISCACSTTSTGPSGPWHPHLDPHDLQVGLRHMVLTRVFDERMQRAQRTGKISFYMRSLGEEAVSVAQCMALRPRGHAVPVVPQPGPLHGARQAAGGPDVPAAVQHPRHVQGPPAAGDVSLERRPHLLDLRQPDHAVPAGRRLGHGGGDQGRGRHRASAGSARARAPRRTSTTRCCSRPCTRRR